MFHNYFFLKRLSLVLNNELSGITALTCFSQNKDELIIGFGDADRDFFIRASLDPAICLIDFPHVINKAKKNYADLFEEIIDKKVLSVEVFKYERSFQIILEDHYSLIFKMHASRSNILLAQNDKVLRIFKSQLKADETLNIQQLSKDLSLKKPDFEISNGDPKRFLPALGKEVNEYLTTSGYFKKDLEDQWVILQSLLAQLQDHSILIYGTEPPTLSLLPLNEKVIFESENPLLTANEFRKYFIYHHFSATGKNRELKVIDEKIQRITNYIGKTKDREQEIHTRRNYGEIANLIMANLNNIPSGSSTTTLNDFYTGEAIDIKLKANLTPQKNAENYYRKSKNQKLETDQLKANILKKEKELQSLILLRKEVSEADDSRALRKIAGKPKKDDRPPLPYLEYHIDGYVILIGKNAKSNDELTLRVAKKDDLWLHAKDVAGSHVVIKHQSGKPFPKNVLERAAEIAAWYSKRKNDSLCPVIYTPKKFVRKRKGDPPGAMVVEKEEVMMVEPRPIK